MKNKKTLLICLCAALAVGAVAGTTVAITQCEKEPHEEQPGGVAFNGTYYADVNGSELLFTLQDNAFTWAVGTDTKTGTYEYDGTSTLKVKFDGESEIAGKVEDGVLTITYNGTKYTFYEKVTYTVSLSSGGAVSVVNGKTVAKPETPTNEDGKKFVGWYKDAAFKNAYDFDELVRGDMTLYARFETPFADANDEFAVTLMVDGVALEADVTTVGGVVYAGTLPTPTKEGATFAGWWTSDYNDATKLTAKCVEFAVEEPTTLYAVWKSNAPLVSATAKEISWTTGKTGSQVKLKITPPTGDPVEKTLKTNSYDYEFSTRLAGDYVIEVTADGETTTVYYQNKGLAKVSAFEVDGFVLKWNAVSKATKYLVSVECGSAGHTHVDEEVTTTEYNFANCDMKTDGIKFVVKAAADGYVTSVSEEYVVVRNLDAVSNLAYDATNAKFTWDAVANATSYAVTVNGTSYTADTNFFDVKTFGAVELNVTVAPVAKGYNSSAAATLTATKANVAAPTGIKLTASTVTWTPVTGAVSYVVNVNGTDYPVNGTSFDLTNAGIDDNATSCTVTVKAVGATEVENSVFSDVVNVNFGTMADTLTYAAGKVKWDPVMNVEKYEVRVNGGTATEVVATEEEAAITFTQDGTNVIEVRCYDLNGNPSDWVSVEVEVYEITYNYGVSLETKAPVYKAVGDTFELPANPETPGYTFGGWYNAAQNGTRYTSNTVTFNPTNGTEVFAKWNAKTYKLTFIADGVSSSTYVKYGDSFYLAPPAGEEDAYFGGWWTEENGQGIQYTDNQGFSVGVWSDTQDVTVYACTIELYEYVKVTSIVTGEDGWSVKKGSDIGKVKEIKIPANYNGLPVIGIESMGFAECGNLEKISMPDTMESIFFGLDSPYSGAGSAFYRCSLLEEFEVYEVEGNHEKRYASGPNGELIYYNEFNGVELKFVPYCWELDEYRIPDVVTTIPTNLFKSYGGIKKLIIPASVTNIDSGAFYSFKATEIVFESAQDDEETKPLIFGEKVFQYSYIESITLPARMENYEVDGKLLKDLFYYCDDLLEIKVEESSEAYSAKEGYLYNKAGDTLLYAPRGIKGDVVIPSGTRKIAQFAFGSVDSIDSCQWITSVTIPATVTEIQTKAFRYCSALHTVNFLGQAGDEQIDIGEEAFYYTVLSGLTLPENIGYISKYAFGEIKTLTTVTVNASLDPVYDETTKAYKSGFAVETGAFGTAKNVYYVTTLNLGKDVPIFDVNGAFGPTKLSVINLDPQNTKLKLDDGVLFDYDVTQIVYYSATKTGSYTIPSTIKNIGGNVFNGKSIEEVSIPFTVEIIGDAAFANCERLSKVTFLPGAEGVKHSGLTIGNMAFQNSSGITDFVLPSYVKSIGAQAFESCEGITGKFVVPEGVTTIGDAAFRYCTGITIIELPSTLTEMATGQDNSGSYYPVYYRTFRGCDSLEEINVASANTTFASTDGILYKLSEAGVKTELIACPSNYAKNDGKAVIDGTVRTIWAYAFGYTVGLKEVSFAAPVLAEGETEASLTISLGKQVFEGSTGLKKVTLGKGVRLIDQKLFYQCSALEYVFIPNTVNEISASSPFTQCYALKDIVFEEGNTSNKLVIKGSTSPDYAYTGSSAFYKLTSLVRIEFPERTEEIGNMAFVDCENLEEVIIPSSVKKIGNTLFGAGSNKTYVTGCPKLRKVVIGDGDVPLTIGKRTFMATNLEDFTIPARTVAIGEYAFASSTIEEAFIPASVEKIDQYAFQYCPNLTSVTFEEGSKLKSIGQYAFASNSIEEIEIPASVESIGNYAFAYTENLTSITFQESAQVPKAEGEGYDTVQNALKSVGNYAFRQSGITELSFPESTNTITLGTDLFQYCPRLEKVHLSSSVASIKDSFGHCGTLKTVTVSPENKNFKAEGSTLYNADKTAIQYLFERVDTDADGVYRIADGVTEIGEAAFRGQLDIKTLYIPASVKKIGDSAFRYCINLETIVFETTDCQLTEIGNYTFEGCNKLTNVVLPNTVTKLGNYTFAATGITSIQMNGVKTIGNYTFSNCKDLTGVDLPSGLTTVGNYAFAYSGLTSLKVPAGLTFSSVTSSSANAFIFRGCKDLTSVTFEEGATKIGYGMFRECTSLTSVKLSSTVKEFGYYALSATGLTSFEIPDGVKVNGYVFYGCEYLKSVKLPADMTELPAYLFYNCTSLGADVPANKSGVEIPKGVNVVRNYVFSGCTSLKAIEFPDGTTEFGNTSKWSSSTTSYLFYGCTSLERVVLPRTLEKIAGNAFQGCISLKTVENLMNVTTIYTSAFRNTGLESITLPAIETLGTYAFAESEHLSEVVLNDALSTIQYYTFQYCPALKTIELPMSLAVLGAPSSTTGGVFMGSGLEEITLPAGIGELKKDTFKDCVNLRSVTFEGPVHTIGDYAFAGCTNLEDFTLPESLLSVGQYAFYESGITEVFIPSGTTSIGMEAFSGCFNLEEFEVSDENVYYSVVGGVLCDKFTGEWMGVLTDYAADNGKLTITNETELSVIEDTSIFAGNTGITEIEITADWTEIPYGMFYGMKNLTKVTLPATLEAIGAYAFAECPNLTTINIPAATKVIGNNAFENCASITTIDLASVEEIGEYAFVGTKLTAVTIPTSMKTIYRYAFYGIDTLKTLTINEGVETIGGYAFAATGISSVTVPASVKTMGSTVSVTDMGSSNTVTLNITQSHVFEDCTSLVEATFLGAVDFMGYTFKGCTALTTVNLSEGTKMIGNYMFYGCTNLKTLNIPSTVTTLGGFAFAYSGIQEVKIPAGVTCIGTPTPTTDPYQTGSTTGQTSGMYWEFGYPNGHVFMGCTNLTKVEFLSDNTLKQIGWYAFEGCTALESITLPNSVQIIGNYAFANCTVLKSLNVPTGALFIGEYAFANAVIESVVIPTSTVVYTNAFDGWKATQVIKTGLSAYKAYSIWSLTWHNGCAVEVEFDYVEDTQE